MSDRQRQLDELVLLESMYPEELELEPPSALESPSTVEDSVTISFKLRMPSYQLEVTLPPTYPSVEKPSAYLQCDETVTTAKRRHARRILAEVLEALPIGAECLDVLAGELSEKLSVMTPDPNVREPTFCDASIAEILCANDVQPQGQVRRLLIWSHHLLATSKRKDIVAWARELCLSGFSRPGYPGAVVIEGAADATDDFETRIKGLRWQALQVRSEGTGESRRFVANDKDIGFKEVEELSDIVKGLKECDGELAEWFLEGMRIGHG